MSATRNTESVAAKHEEFSSRVPPSEPLTTKGHKPGVLVGNDAKPEFHAEQLPAGSAPREATYQPRPAEGENAATGNVDAASTLTGATSQDVYQGYGKPMQGQENVELRHDGGHTSKHVGSGLAGVGAPNAGRDVVRERGADLPEGVTKGSRGKATDAYPSAEERVPESAETVGSERR
ncbi:hypothetical protein PG985_011188 [Apiospora marii]|uniref:Uncharacterized protein n=1 Tax=Apiospora marii TaxID=335849 RepID=A0ABR1SVA4_9PEZI